MELPTDISRWNFDGWHWAAQKSVAQVKPEKQNMEQKL